MLPELRNCFLCPFACGSDAIVVVVVVVEGLAVALDDRHLLLDAHEPIAAFRVGRDNQEQIVEDKAMVEVQHTGEKVYLLFYSCIELLLLTS